MYSSPDLSERIHAMLEYISEKQDLYQMVQETGFLEIFMEKIKGDKLRRSCEGKGSRNKTGSGIRGVIFFYCFE